MENTSRYTLQLRFVADTSDASFLDHQLEILAHPTQTGQLFQGRFLLWEPVFEEICQMMRSSAFHRKAIQRTLTAGLAADLINRETGSKHIFTAEELAALSLTPYFADSETGLSTAAAA